MLPGTSRFLLLCVFICFSLFNVPADEDAGLDEIERTVLSMVPDPQYPHDPFILATLKEAVGAKRHKSGGGVGACLVRESTGKFWSGVATGRLPLISGATCMRKWTS